MWTSFCELANVTYSNRADDRDHTIFCIVPDSGYDSILFISLALLVAAIATHRLNSASVFVLGCLTQLLSFKYNLGRLGNAISILFGVQPPETFFFIFLPPVLLNSLLHVDYFLFRKVSLLSLCFAASLCVTSVAFSAPLLLFALGLAGTGWSWNAALLFSTLVASTEARKVSSILNLGGIPTDLLPRLLEAESVFNSALGLVSFNVLYHTTVRSSSSDVSLSGYAQSVLWQFGGGLVAGVCFGFLTIQLLRLVQWRRERPYVEVALSLAGAYLLFYVSEAVLSCSGSIAVMCYGLIGASSQVWYTSIQCKREGWLFQFWEVVDFSVRGFVFFFIGVSSTNILSRISPALPDLEATAALWALARNMIGIYVILTLLRGAVVSLFVPFLEYIFGVKIQLTWQRGLVSTLGGLRGCVTLVMAQVLLSQQSGPDIADDNMGISIATEMGLYAVGYVMLTLVVNSPFISLSTGWLKLNTYSAVENQVRVESKSAIVQHSQTLMKALQDHAAELVMAGVNWKLVSAYVDVEKELDLILVENAPDVVHKSLSANGTSSYGSALDDELKQPLLGDANEVTPEATIPEKLTRPKDANRMLVHAGLSSSLSALSSYTCASDLTCADTQFSQNSMPINRLAAAVAQIPSNAKKPVLVIDLRAAHHKLSGITTGVAEEISRDVFESASEMPSSSVTKMEPASFPHISSGQSLDKEYWDMVTADKDGNVFFMKQPSNVVNGSLAAAKSQALPHTSNIMDLTERNRSFPVVISMEDSPVHVPQQIRVRLILDLKRTFYALHSEGLMSQRALNILSHAFSIAARNPEEKINLWSSAEKEVHDSAWLATMHFSLRTFIIWIKYKVPWMPFRDYLCAPLRFMSSRLARHLGRVMQTGLDVALNLRQALMISCEQPWLDTLGILGDALKAELSDQASQVSRFITQREVEAPDRFQAIQSHRAALAVLRHQQKFVGALREVGLVDDQKVEELLMPIERRLWKLQRLGPRWKQPSLSQILLNVPFLKDMSGPALDWLMSHGRLARYSNGDRVLPRSHARGFFIVISGVVRRCSSAVTAIPVEDDAVSSHPSFCLGTGSIGGLVECLGHDERMITTGASGSAMYYAQANALGKGPVLFRVPQACVDELYERSQGGQEYMKELLVALCRLAGKILLEEQGPWVFRHLELYFNRSMSTSTDTIKLNVLKASSLSQGLTIRWGQSCVNGVSHDIFSATGVYCWTFFPKASQNARRPLIPSLNTVEAAHAILSHEPTSSPSVPHLQGFTRVLLASMLAEFRQGQVVIVAPGQKVVQRSHMILMRGSLESWDGSLEAVPLFEDAGCPADLVPELNPLGAEMVGHEEKGLHEKRRDAIHSNCVQVKSSSLLLWLPGFHQPSGSISGPLLSASYVAGCEGAVLLTRGDHGLETVHQTKGISTTAHTESLNPKIANALATALGAPTNAPLGQTMQSAIDYESLQDLLHSTDNASIMHSSSSIQASMGSEQRGVRPALSHRHLKLFLATEMRKQLQAAGMGGIKGLRIGIAVPNGPEAGLAVLTAMCYGTCCPVNPAATKEEMVDEFKAFGVHCCLMMDGKAAEQSGYMPLADGLEVALQAAGIKVLLMLPCPLEPVGIFSLNPAPLVNTSSKSAPEDDATDGVDVLDVEDVDSLESVPASLGIADTSGLMEVYETKRQGHGLLLHTSGTSGKKKVVPYTLDALVVGALCVAESWALKPCDTCLNMMPLFHAGGIIRNLLAPVLSGGSTCLESGFEPQAFWRVVQSHGITWYYAAPTIHLSIVQEAARMVRNGLGDALKHKVRMVGNAAGPLLPSLAADIKSTFGMNTSVLPSYGMTECMPISCPPVDYQLDRPGTSGRAVGPELSIRQDEALVTASPLGEVGRICVRGPPVFNGYLDLSQGRESAAPTSPFGFEGWFDTGDLGYMDADGYLYITGRSKEVINRGGEIISPVEVEDAVATHPSVQSVAAITVPHDALQEVVGVAITTRKGRARPGLKQLQDHVSSSLHPSKWPQLVVYMDSGLPMTATNKVPKVNMASRLGLPQLTDLSPLSERLFEAITPEKGAPVKEPIPCSPVDLSFSTNQSIITEAIESAARLVGCPIGEAGISPLPGEEARMCVVAFIVCKGEESQGPVVWGEKILQRMEAASLLPTYLLPRAIISVQSLVWTEGSNQLDFDWVKEEADRALSEMDSKTGLCLGIMQIMAEVLEVPNLTSPETDFFAVGGNSLKAGRLIGRLRQCLPDVSMQVNLLYSAPTPVRLAATLRAQGVDSNHLPASMAGVRAPLKPDCEAYEPRAWNVLLVQALPLCLFVPTRRVATFLIFCLIISYLPIQGSPGMSLVTVALFKLVLASIITHRVVSPLLYPWVGIFMKWLLIGRYRDTSTAAPFPLWGSYYLRWWIVQQILREFGRGFFDWNDNLLQNYYRLLGAKIGKGVHIHKSAQLGEYDLLDIKDGAFISSKATVRPFHLVSGGFALHRITIGVDSTVGVRGMVVPGTVMPERSYIWPNASTYEMQMNVNPEEARRSSRDATSPPPWWLLLLVMVPLTIVSEFLSRLPQFLIVAVMFAVTNPIPRAGIVGTLLWFANPVRYPWFILSRIAKRTVVPFCRLGASIMIKNIFFRPLKPGPLSHSPWERLQYYFLDTFLRRSKLSPVRMVLGRNLEGMSWLLRFLGAKVGKGVFHSGTGFETVDYDLIEIGDYAVFGSRSTLIGTGAHERGAISIGSGAMLADRCCMVYNSSLGCKTVMGSGGFLPSGYHLEDGSTWLGSSRDSKPLLWSKGSPEDLGRSPETPYSRALHGKAPYFVWPLPLHVFFNLIVIAVSTTWWQIPIIGALFTVFEDHFKDLQSRSIVAFPYSWELLIQLLLFWGVFICFYTLTVVGASCIDITSKWFIIGRRRTGSCSWDEMDYCQRWIIHKVIQKCFVGSSHHGCKIYSVIGGSQWMTWYLEALGAKIGDKCCLYPDQGDPVMTEPDLVSVGSGACVDNASLVSHINSRGIFQLNNLVVGEGAVMRSKTRLLSGASMGPYSTMLENTLVVSGDVLGPGTVWQGWPASLRSAQKT
ncbi:hypothetical protein CEUSTIGMA_g12518.t1 [Chlamydomonas eustigma]|uniref:Carrier domain-containing protein n=1 Tax=Chlamydomonas eustigma TaxID=1157962 RepID=A0A250XPW0_9CHLO|nr:hypothetical protein CEUSTIGMA_g12518.t1 [Chlamydomonas eustigma]|eukprot:GAX85098.1 hypothetical protein CEUSTIGMA_g12518.t1 [Chlamydomonas eustigma]